MCDVYPCASKCTCARADVHLRKLPPVVCVGVFMCVVYACVRKCMFAYVHACCA